MDKHVDVTRVTFCDIGDAKARSRVETLILRFASWFLGRTMKTAIAKVLRPLESPEETPPPGGWERVERELGTRLPADYKNYIERYGTGTINNFMMILNPFSKNRYVNLLSGGKMVCDAYRTSRENGTGYFKDNVFPEEGGILPFASTDNGDVLYWRTVGLPDQWPLRVYDARSPDYFDYDGSMTEFLADLLTGAITCTVLPDLSKDGKSEFKVVHIPSPK